MICSVILLKTKIYNSLIIIINICFCCCCFKNNNNIKKYSYKEEEEEKKLLLFSINFDFYWIYYEFFSYSTYDWQL